MPLIIELLIVFLGIPLLIFMVIRQNHRIEKVSTQSKVQTDLQKSLWNKELEFTIRECWNTCDMKKTWDLVSEIPTDDLQFIFGDDWKQLLTDFFERYPHLAYNNDLSNIYNILEVLIMSQRGYEKMFQKYVLVGGITGFPTEYDVYKSEPPSYDYVKKIWPDMRKRVCKIVEKNIRHKYPDVEMFINPYDSPSTTGHEYGFRAIWSFEFAPFDNTSRREKPWGNFS